MTTMHLNPQVQKFGGLTPVRGVFGRAPKMQIGTVGNPHFSDFVTPKEAQTTKTHRLLGIIHQIRQSSLTEDFNGKLDFRLNRRVRRSRNGEFSRANRRFSFLPIGQQKGETSAAPSDNYCEIWARMRAISFPGDHIWELI